MPRSTTTLSITDRIQELLSERQQHAAAIAVIDKTLSQIGSLLGAPAATVGRGRKSMADGSAMIDASPLLGIKGRKRMRYAMTAEESILAFVKERGNPTTQDLREHWRNEGRKGSADNTLSLLVKNRKLKRTKLQGQRGSKYSLA